MLKEITITGMKKAFVVLVAGREVGTVCQYNRSSRWQACVGIGRDAAMVGTAEGKGAAALLVEKEWMANR